MRDELSQKVLQARIKLMLNQSYLAAAIARFPLVNAEGLDWCDTMATDGYFIYINPGFCDALTTEEISFVFAHEVMHCVLGHMDRRGARPSKLWNIAIDYATNLMLVEFGLKMPDDGLYDRRYRGLTAEDIYDQLDKAGSDKEASSYSSPGGLGDTGPSNIRTGGFDVHLDPSDDRGRAIRNEDFPTAEERNRIRISITKEMVRKLKGNVAGLMESEIKKATKTTIPWKTLLARFFTGLRRDDYRMMPPNKKHIHRGLYLPSMGVPGPDHLVVAIDTSGSMGDEELSKILAEIDTLRSVTQCAMTLIQCDASIQDVKEFDEYSLASFERYRFLGRGGTSFVPVFDWIRENMFDKNIAMDALIYLTDGFGDFPSKPPPYPALWIMTEYSNPDVPFGEIIRMQTRRAAA